MFSQGLWVNVYAVGLHSEHEPTSHYPDGATALRMLKAAWNIYQLINKQHNGHFIGQSFIIKNTNTI